MKYKSFCVILKHEFIFSLVQVSYIIMNGTTWDLEVKGIKRTKRDVVGNRGGTPHLSSGHLVVPFIDTRAFPHNVHPSQRPQASRWVSRRHVWKGNHHARQIHSIRHLRGAARIRALESQPSRHIRRKIHNQARLKSIRMRGGRPRLSRETTLDTDIQRNFGSIVKVGYNTEVSLCAVIL